MSEASLFVGGLWGGLGVTWSLWLGKQTPLQMHGCNASFQWPQSRKSTSCHVQCWCCGRTGELGRQSYLLIVRINVVHQGIHRLGEVISGAHVHVGTSGGLSGKVSSGCQVVVAHRGLHDVGNQHVVTIPGKCFGLTVFDFRSSYPGQFPEYCIWMGIVCTWVGYRVYLTLCAYIMWNVVYYKYI